MGLTLAEKVAAIERKSIAEALTATGGNKSETARRLNITRPYLYRRLKALFTPDELAAFENPALPPAS